jgi:hypothetical protein
MFKGMCKGSNRLRGIGQERRILRCYGIVTIEVDILLVCMGLRAYHTWLNGIKSDWRR